MDFHKTFIKFIDKGNHFKSQKSPNHSGNYSDNQSNLNLILGSPDEHRRNRTGSTMSQGNSVANSSGLTILANSTCYDIRGTCPQFETKLLKWYKTKE